jgi:hypothetical protein
MDGEYWEMQCSTPTVISTRSKIPDQANEVGIMATDNQTIRFSAAVLLAMILGSYVFATSADASSADKVSRINGSVEIDAGQTVGDVSTINGRIRVSRNATAGAVETINGSITIQSGATIDSAETVNGGIRLGRDVQVGAELKTVNGGIQVDPGSFVAADIRTLNGEIALRDTRVTGSLHTANGDIELREGSVIEGDVIIRGERSWISRLFSFGQPHRSELQVDASSVILGDIHLYRDVELRIEEGAEVGEIIRH